MHTTPRALAALLLTLIALATTTQPQSVVADSQSHQSAHADSGTYLAATAATLSKSWPDNAMVTVVCHGHSVPAGYFRTPEIRPFDSYPHLAHQLVQTRFPTGMIEFIRTAIGGEHSEAGAQRFARDVLAKNPDVVLIDYALNDRGIGLVRAKAAWTSMIEAALEQGVRLILLTPTSDTNANDDTPDQSLEAHSNQIRELASAYGVGLVDSYAIFERYRAEHGSIEPLMSQSNHPNREGHSLVAARVAEWFTRPAR